MSGDTRSWCRSLIWAGGSAGSCLVPGMGEAAWYAELQAQLTSSADRAEKKSRDYKNRLTFFFLLLLLSLDKSGWVCIRACRKEGVGWCTGILTYSHHSARFDQTSAFSSASFEHQCALQWHVCGLIQDSVLWHELSLLHSSETAASPFDPNREIHLDYLI